jgi:hypothetical protein
MSGSDAIESAGKMPAAFDLNQVGSPGESFPGRQLTAGIPGSFLIVRTLR